MALVYTALSQLFDVEMGLVDNPVRCNLARVGYSLTTDYQDIQRNSDCGYRHILLSGVEPTWLWAFQKPNCQAYRLWRCFSLYLGVDSLVCRQEMLIRLATDTSQPRWPYSGRL